MRIEDYTSDELVKIFEEELDRLGIPYHYDSDVKFIFEPLTTDEPVLEV